MALTQAYRRQYGREWISAVPTNLYGPGDKYDPTNSHVVPAIIRKVHEASRTGDPIVVWGSGEPRRELLHVDDCADACIYLCAIILAMFTSILVMAAIFPFSN
jgi:GDP-L-fucose synthase